MLSACSLTGLPVQELDRRHLPALKRHFAGLGAEDRHRRFGTTLAASAVEAYVDGIDFAGGPVFGVIADDGSLLGVAHLPCRAGVAELGLSVLPAHRHRGIGSALLRRAVMHARNLQIGELFMHCLAGNGAIIGLARAAGMKVLIDHAEAECHLELAPGTPATLGQEMVERQIALFDASFRAQVVHARRLSELYAQTPAA